MKILITGASGFIGSRAVEYLIEKTDVRLRVLPGRNGTFAFDGEGRIEAVPYREIHAGTFWGDALVGVDTVLHLAGRAHILSESSFDSLIRYRTVNVEGSLNLGKQAAQAGVKRFIFISSIGVNGNKSSRPFTVNDPPNPVESYAVSKLEAEEGLRSISGSTEMELVIIRPPLVYGPEAPGNFERLLHLVQAGVPLPLSLVRNKRSLIALDNLVDLIITCIDHPAAAGQILLVSDGEDLSTPDLIRKLAKAMGCKARLFPFPPGMLRLGGRIAGKSAEVERLIGSLQVDISHTCKTIGWRPAVSVEDALFHAVSSR